MLWLDSVESCPSRGFAWLRTHRFGGCAAPVAPSNRRLHNTTRDIEYKGPQSVRGKFFSWRKRSSSSTRPRVAMLLGYLHILPLSQPQFGSTSTHQDSLRLPAARIYRPATSPSFVRVPCFPAVANLDCMAGTDSFWLLRALFRIASDLECFDQC